MTRRLFVISVCYGGLLVLLFTFRPVTPRVVAQTGDTTPNPYIDALGTQAALNTQATLAAYQQQQSAAAAANAAAQAQAQAAYAAQQATWAAGQQQAALAAAQSTADAAALQATAIVQQTRTALEFQATQEAARVSLETTQQALRVLATREAINAEATRSSVEAQRHDNAAIATSVAVSIEATRAAIAMQAEIEHREAVQQVARLNLGNLILNGVMISAGLLALVLLGKLSLGLWRSRALNPLSQATTSRPITPVTSEASTSIVDAATGAVGSRFALIEYRLDPEGWGELLEALDGR